MKILDGDPASPFHRGETTIQEFVGVREQMRAREPFLRDHLTSQQRAFFEGLSYLCISAADSEGWPVASIIDGEIGFISTPDPQKLKLAILSSSMDPVLANLQVGKSIGILGIELATRRRNRVFGTISVVEEQCIEITIVQAFGNCPQYIQARQNEATSVARPRIDIDGKISGLDEPARELIRHSDCFHVATTVNLDDDDPRSGMDMSHRGGLPGFVDVADNVLSVPDFPGNYFFNTLGNLLLDPRAGLVFWDFESGDLLHVWGTVEIIWDDLEVDAFRGAERLWRICVKSCQWQRQVMPPHWQLLSYSPMLSQTGNWEEAKKRVIQDADDHDLQEYVVQRIVDEADGIKSFYLSSQDWPQPVYLAGQFLPVQLSNDPGAQNVQRNYTLTSAPSDSFLRISVKQDGRVSSAMHEDVTVGNVMFAKRPSGAFTINAEDNRPAILIAAGIGITPMISFLRHLIGETIRPRFRRPVILVHAAARVSEQPFRSEIADMEASSEGFLRTLFIVENTTSEDIKGRHFDAIGRIDDDHIDALCANADADFYLCGPPGFMQVVYNALIRRGVEDLQIHVETFGPASLKRERSHAERETQSLNDGVVEVEFTISNRTVAWHPRDGTLLELAEAVGIAAPFSCRAGWCGTCMTKTSGAQTECVNSPSAEMLPGTTLLCSARPMIGDNAIMPKIRIEL